MLLPAFRRDDALAQGSALFVNDGPADLRLSRVKSQYQCELLGYHPPAGQSMRGRARVVYQAGKAALLPVTKIRRTTLVLNNLAVIGEAFASMLGSDQKKTPGMRL